MKDSRFLKEFAMKMWANDVAAYERWKNFRNTTTNLWYKDYAQKHMDKIQSRWPNHSMEG